MSWANGLLFLGFATVHGKQHKPFTDAQSRFEAVRLLSSQLATSVLCLITDGMDQAKFKCPRVVGRRSKHLDSLYRPTLHCTGVWCHGVRLFLWLANEDVKKDSVTQCELIFRSLSIILQTHSQLPLGCHLQADNCFRENKNQYVGAAMMLLVILQVFRWTSIGFLRTGHSCLGETS